MAAKRKQCAYGLLKEALSYYTDQGWVIHIFPWVVAFRGVIDPRHIESLLRFLGIQRKHWQVAVERSVPASVRAFHFLHTVRLGGRSDAMRTAFDPENSEINRTIAQKMQCLRGKFITTMQEQLKPVQTLTR